MTSHSLYHSEEAASERRMWTVDSWHVSEGYLGWNPRKSTGREGKIVEQRAFSLRRGLNYGFINKGVGQRKFHTCSFACCETLFFLGGNHPAASQSACGIITFHLFLKQIIFSLFHENILQKSTLSAVNPTRSVTYISRRRHSYMEHFINPTFSKNLQIFCLEVTSCVNSHQVFELIFMHEHNFLPLFTVMLTVYRSVEQPHCDHADHEHVHWRARSSAFKEHPQWSSQLFACMSLNQSQSSQAAFNQGCSYHAPVK